GRADFSLLARMPADGGWIEEDFGSLQRRQPRRLRVPLIPADEHADSPVARVEGAEAQVAGCKIIFFEVERIVGNMHLAIEPEQAAVSVQHSGGVMGDAGWRPRENTSE